MILSKWKIINYLLLFIIYYYILLYIIIIAKMSLPILAIFCTSFCISCQIQQLQHLSIAAAPFPNQDWGTIPAEHDKEENQRPQLRWDSLLAPAHKQVMSPRGCKL